MESLQHRLDEFKKSLESGAPPYHAPREAVETMHRPTTEVNKSGAGEEGHPKNMGTQVMTFASQRSFFSYEDNALVARARAGDSVAFTDLVLQHYRMIYRLATRITGNGQDAEDVLQETFLKAYKHMASFQGNSRFSTWINRIAVNEAFMKLRKRRNYPTVSLDEPLGSVEGMGKREVAVWSGNPEQQYSQREIQGILEQALECLRPKCRAVFVLCDVEEFSLEETAEILGTSISATKSRLFRARMALRGRLTRRFKTRSCRGLVVC